jgi:ADP-heptose:LPS heptosyltransferase
MTGSPKKILLVQLFSNGDCLYATTIAKQIKTDFPGCHLTWAIASFCKEIIANNPYVDEVMEISTIAKNDVVAFRAFKRIVAKQKKQGLYDEVFVTQNMDTNQAFYDGTIRGNALKAYPNPITVPVTPVLVLSEKEIQTAKKFAEQNTLSNYKNIVLFEYAPQSGQSAITKDFAISIAEGLVVDKKTAVILSSANIVSHTHNAIIDGSSLTLRETAALTHYCTFLLGSSSGITWISTSEGAKQLPMVQLLNANTSWVNPISRDFKRYHFSTKYVIELLNFTEAKIIDCVQYAINDFEGAKNKFNEPIPLHFKTTGHIVYNLLCYAEFGAIYKHIQINKAVYGNNISFYKEVILQFIIFPFKLIRNVVAKRLQLHQ